MIFQYKLLLTQTLWQGSKNEEEEFNTGPLSVLMMSVKNNTQVNTKYIIFNALFIKYQSVLSEQVLNNKLSVFVNGTLC